jgi:3-hydroxyisobutyrate dehydrogenase-like beta-hydroxyacid dehydrogenase
MKPEHIEDNTLGPNGIAAAGKAGLIHVEMSTMYPDWQRALARRLGERGIEMLDAPISGSHNRVDARTISFMVGGNADAFDRVRPILEPLAVDVTHTGPSGSGATMKIVINLFVTSSAAVLAETILVGERAGLDKEIMKKCMSVSTVQGMMFNQIGMRLLARDFAPRGAVDIYVKDSGLAIDLAKACGIDLKLVPAAREMFLRAQTAGWGEDDAARVIEVYEGKDRSG